METDGFLNSDGFLVVFPCYAIMSDDCLGAVVHTIHQRDAMVFFTDEDLLRRYRREYANCGPTIRFEFAGQIALYLDAVPKKAPLVVFDPDSRVSHCFPVSRLAKYIADHIGD